MNTTETFSAAELADSYRVGSLSDLTTHEIEQLVLVGGAVLDSIQCEHFAKWWHKTLRHELNVRMADGKLEPGTIAMDYRLLSDEIGESCLRIHCMRGMTVFSESQQRWIASVHERLQIQLISKIATCGHPTDRLLTKREVADCLRVEPEDIAKLVRQGVVPKPIRLSPRICRWHATDVLAALANL